MSAAPPRVGLTQALGGEKHFVVVLLATADNLLRLALLFGHVHNLLHLRLVRQARSHVACVAHAGFGSGDWLSAGLPAPDAVASVTVGG